MGSVFNRPFFHFIGFAGQINPRHIVGFTVDQEHIVHIVPHFLAERNLLKGGWFAQVGNRAQAARQRWILGILNADGSQ